MKFVVIFLSLLSLVLLGCQDRKEVFANKDIFIKLPPPKYFSKVSVEGAIKMRTSVRDFSDVQLNTSQLGQLLWSCGGFGVDGVTSATRVIPSAGATYPTEIYAVVKKVEGIDSGVYYYNPQKHQIELVKRGVFNDELATAALNQPWVRKAPLNIVMAMVPHRITRVYGERGIRYAYFEIGHIGQNLHLQAYALGLGTVMIGAFYEEKVARLLNLPKDQIPLYIAPVGYPKK